MADVTREGHVAVVAAEAREHGNVAPHDRRRLKAVVGRDVELMLLGQARRHERGLSAIAGRRPRCIAMPDDLHVTPSGGGCGGYPTQRGQRAPPQETRDPST